MQPHGRPLTARTLLTLAIGLAVLGGLTIYRLRPLSSPYVDEYRGPTMGTFYTVKIVKEIGDRDAQLSKSIQSELDSINQKMSTYLADSELSLFNRASNTEPFSMSPETIAVFAMAQTISEATGGAFDITVGALVNAWGFGPEEQSGTPTTDEIEILLARIGYEKVVVNEQDGTVRKTEPDLYCDLSAIAKGYAVDRLCRLLDEMDLRNYLVEIGGETRTSGLNGRGEPWAIGVGEPLDYERALHRVVLLSGQAMATSGDYRNFFTEDGQRFSHTIDPRTGRPLTHGLTSVSVIHTECALAHGYATALMVLGLEDGLRLAEELGLAALFLQRAGDGIFEETTTAAFNDFLETIS